MSSDMRKRILPIMWPYYRNTKCPRCFSQKARGRVHLRLCDRCEAAVEWFRKNAVVKPSPFVREPKATLRRLASMKR